jgi:hypothetical protein
LLHPLVGVVVPLAPQVLVFLFITVSMVVLVVGRQKVALLEQEILLPFPLPKEITVEQLLTMAVQVVVVQTLLVQVQPLLLERMGVMAPYHQFPDHLLPMLVAEVVERILGTVEPVEPEVGALAETQGQMG